MRDLSIQGNGETLTQMEEHGHSLIKQQSNEHLRELQHLINHYLF